MSALLPVGGGGENNDEDNGGLGRDGVDHADDVAFVGGVDTFGAAVMGSDLAAMPSSLTLSCLFSSSLSGVLVCTSHIIVMYVTSQQKTVFRRLTPHNAFTSAPLRISRSAIKMRLFTHAACSAEYPSYDTAKKQNKKKKQKTKKKKLAKQLRHRKSCSNNVLFIDIGSILQQEFHGVFVSTATCSH
jgi:hypothetical protein